MWILDLNICICTAWKVRWTLSLAPQIGRRCIFLLFLPFLLLKPSTPDHFNNFFPSQTRHVFYQQRWRLRLWKRGGAHQVRLLQTLALGVFWRFSTRALLCCDSDELCFFSFFHYATTKKTGAEPLNEVCVCLRCEEYELTEMVNTYIDQTKIWTLVWGVSMRIILY